MLTQLKIVLKKSVFIKCIHKFLMNMKREIENYYLKCTLISKYKHDKNPDFKEILNFLRKNKLYLYNYEWYKKEYLKLDVKSYFDAQTQFHYFLYKGRKIYYNKKLGGGIENNFRLMIAEQDNRCPHCYDNFIYNTEYFDVIIDAGCAEGMFSVKHLNQADKIVLIEGDKNWVNALRYTFKDEIERGKVILISKFLSDENNEEFITLNRILDEFLDSPQNILIKMDIEGYEEKALKAAEYLINKGRRIKVIACSYHHLKAEQNIRSIFESYGMNTVCSSGYMFLFPQYEKTIFHETDSEGVIPSLRRSLIIGTKNVSS